MSALNLIIQYHFWLVHDNDSNHPSKTVKERILYNVKKVMPKELRSQV